jgi:hypothetical protein
MIKPLDVTYDFSVVILIAIKYHIQVSLKYSKVAGVYLV